MEFFYTPSFFSPQLFLSRLLITNVLMSIYNVVPSEAQLWPHDLLTVRLSDRTVAEKLLGHSTRPLNIQDGHRIWLGKQDGTRMVQIGGSPSRIWRITGRIMILQGGQDHRHDSRILQWSQVQLQLD